MRVVLTCPAPPRSRKGNRVTAVRYSRLLRAKGHAVRILKEYDGSRCDVVIALHARRSHASIARYRQIQRAGGLAVVLTGTDLYRDIHHSRLAKQSLQWADALVALQDQAPAELPANVLGKLWIIYQSAMPTRKPAAQQESVFEICVLGHLRREKDPFRAALALRRLPDLEHVRVIHAGQALEPEMAERARTLSRRDSRYRWLGELPRWQARRLLARSRLLVLSSRMEGGANVIAEAVVDGVPVAASLIPGSVGMLGSRYPAFYPVGDTEALALLLRRVVMDAAFRSRLLSQCRALQQRFDPEREANALDKLVRHLAKA